PRIATIDIKDGSLRNQNLKVGKGACPRASNAIQSKRGHAPFPTTSFWWLNSLKEMPMSTVMRKQKTQLNRRGFLHVSATAAGGLLVSLYLDRSSVAQEGGGNQPQRPPAKAYPPDAFVHIKPDGKIHITVNRLEFGQGVQTALPMILADEMDADWSQVVAELAPAADVYKDPVFGFQIVGGSGSIAHSFQQYRELGARTRAMLIAAAAALLNVPADQCRTDASRVYGPGGKSATYA